MKKSRMQRPEPSVADAVVDALDRLSGSSHIDLLAPPDALMDVLVLNQLVTLRDIADTREINSLVGLTVEGRGGAHLLRDIARAVVDADAETLAFLLKDPDCPEILRPIPDESGGLVQRMFSRLSDHQVDVLELHVYDLVPLSELTVAEDRLLGEAIDLLRGRFGPVLRQFCRPLLASLREQGSLSYDALYELGFDCPGDAVMFVLLGHSQALHTVSGRSVAIDFDDVSPVPGREGQLSLRFGVE